MATPINKIIGHGQHEHGQLSRWAWAWASARAPPHLNTIIRVSHCHAQVRCQLSARARARMRVTLSAAASHHSRGHGRARRARRRHGVHTRPACVCTGRICCNRGVLCQREAARQNGPVNARTESLCNTIACVPASAHKLCNNIRLSLYMRHPVHRRWNMSAEAQCLRTLIIMFLHTRDACAPLPAYRSNRSNSSCLSARLHHHRSTPSWPASSSSTSPTSTLSPSRAPARYHVACYA